MNNESINKLLKTLIYYHILIILLQETNQTSIAQENQLQSPSLSLRSSEYGDSNPPDVSTNEYDYAAEDGYIEAVNRDIVPDYQEVVN